MRFAIAALGVLLFVGCAKSPTMPDSSFTSKANSRTTQLWGMVIAEDGGGLCIPGATITVIAGPGTGQSQVQETPCNVWGYGGGFVFKDLTPNASMMLRASAPGYVTKEVGASSPSSGPITVFEIVLTKAQ